MRLLLLIGKALVFRTNIRPADYIVLLSGSAYDRAMEAMALYQKGLGKNILIPKAFDPPGYDELRARGLLVLNESELNIELLKQSGIPAGNILITANSCWGTYEEAMAVREFLKGRSREQPSLIIVTSQFHSRRAYKIFKRVLGKIEIMSWPVTKDWIDMDRWWQIRWQRRWIMREYAKVIFYALRYRYWPL